MVKEIILNNTTIQVEKYHEETVNGFQQISVDFKVTSEDYHDITTLLYAGTFDVSVPERGLSFRGSITQYASSITNLYKKGQVGDYSVTLLETKE